jgi:hypothetical protein
MPTLTNARHEAFCQFMARSWAATRAYHLAFPRNESLGAASVSACRLLAFPHIRARIEEIQCAWVEMLAPPGEFADTIAALLRRAKGAKRLKVALQLLGAIGVLAGYVLPTQVPKMPRVRNGAGKQNGELNRLADALERVRQDGAGDEYVQGMELIAECLAVKKKAAAPKEFMLAASKAGETLGKRSNYDQRRVEIRQQAKELAAPYGGSPRLVREIIAGLTIGPLDDSAIEQLAAYCATPPPSRKDSRLAA